jgi:multidrug efflux pump subunit AcrA (membrane-fusion protein)
MKLNSKLLLPLAGLMLQFACSDKKDIAPASAANPAQVQTQAVQQETVPSFIDAPGTVQARNHIALSSQINGFVNAIHVRMGDSVKTGQLLVSLDARDAESQKAAAQSSIEEAQAALSEARKSRQAAVEMRAASKASADLAGQTLRRYEKMFESKSVSPQEMDEVRMRVNASTAELASRESMVSASEDRIKQVEARISQAKANSNRVDVLVSYTQIKAPSSGIIVERSADPGTAIFPGTPLIVLESKANPQVVAEIPTDHINSLHAGMQVRIRNGATGELTEGRVTEITPMSNTATHSVQFKVDLAPKASLSNGQFVKVEVPIGTRKALLAPNTAIRETGQLTGLFVVDSTFKARFRLIKFAPYDADRSEILSGVEPGENIVTRLTSQIVDGISVTSSH